LMIMVTYSSQLIEMNDLSELFFRCKSVLLITSFGKDRCHQNFKVIELPPYASKELSPMIYAVGVLGIKCAMGVSNFIPESGDTAWDRKVSTSRIVQFTRYWWPCLLIIFCGLLHGKVDMSLAV
jgi:hypothetical protein